MISPAQIRAARSLLGWKQSDLATASDLSLTAMNNIERGASDPRASTLDGIQKALEAAGIEFTNGDAPGVKLRLAKRKAKKR
jgi:transcriptional regulator with XRE-family HTH domain